MGPVSFAVLQNMPFFELPITLPHVSAKIFEIYYNTDMLNLAKTLCGQESNPIPRKRQHFFKFILSQVIQGSASNCSSFYAT